MSAATLNQNPNQTDYSFFSVIFETIPDKNCQEEVVEAGPQQLAGNNRGFSRDPAIEVQEPTRHLAETRVQEATRVQEVTPSPGLSPVHWRPDSTPNLASSRGHWRQEPASVSMMGNIERCYSLFMYRINI